MRNIVVVGGGIGGLTFAVAARQAGFEVSVLEREADVVRSGLGGGLGLWPPSQQVMDKIGALAALQQHGRYMPAAAYCTHRGQILAQPSQAFSTRFPILCVERSVLLEVLLARCASEGVEIIREATFESFSTCARTSRVELPMASRDRAMTADVVVGADGIHSAVRGALTAGTGKNAPRPCGYAYFRSSIPAATRSAWPSWHGQAFECWGDGIRFGYVPMREPSVFWFAAVPIGRHGLEPRLGAHALGQHERAWLIDLLADWHGPPMGTSPEQRLEIGKLLQLTRAEEILRTDIYKIEGVTRFPWSNAAGNVVLLGDACHATAPNLAQGAGLSIEDAAELVVQLDAAARNADVPGVREDARQDLWCRELRAAIDRYEEARKPRARIVQTLADAIATVGQLRPPLSRLRNAGMRAATSLLPAASAGVFEALAARSLGGGSRQVTWEHPGVHLPVVEAVTGSAAFERYVPKAEQSFRRLASGGYGSGRVTVEIGGGWLPRLIAGLAGLPPPMTEQSFEASVLPVHRYRERWIRRFGTIRYTTTMSRVRNLGRGGGATGLLLTEGIGGLFDRLIRFSYEPKDATERGLGGSATPKRAVAFESRGLRLGDGVKLPLPSWLQPRHAWIEEEADVATAAGGSSPGWRFDGRIELPPLLGGELLMAYRGLFMPHPQGRQTPDASAAAAQTTQHVIVFGGTGFLGRTVCAELLSRGWYVTVPTRNPKPGLHPRFDHPRYSEVLWQAQAGDATAAALRDVIAIRSTTCSRVVVINLAGENPGRQRWSTQTMQSIVDSRLAAIAVVGELLSLLRNEVATDRLPPQAFPVAMLQASAVGIYGEQGAQPLSDLDPGHPAAMPSESNGPVGRSFGKNEWITERSAVRRGRAFRVACCQILETAAAKLAVPTDESVTVPLQVANLRIGMVLGHGEGLLPHLQRAAAFGTSRIGRGKQYVSWIHVGDAARVIAEVAGDIRQFADEDVPVFAMNLCTPNPLTCSELLAAVRKAQRLSGRLAFTVPAYIPLPAAALTLAVGPAASVLLDSQNAVPARLQSSVTPGELDRLIRFPQIDAALMSWDCAVSSRP